MPNNRTATIFLFAAILSACGVCYVGSEILDAASHRLAVGDGPVPTNTAWATLIGSILSTLGFGWAAAWVGRLQHIANVITPAISGKSILPERTANIVAPAIEFVRLGLYVKLFRDASTAEERKRIRESASIACVDLLNQLFPVEQTRGDTPAAKGDAQ